MLHLIEKTLPNSDSFKEVSVLWTAETAVWVMWADAWIYHSN